MNGYKNIIRSQKMRFAILRALRFIPDKQMLKLQYRIKLGRPLNLDNPQRYTEKIQWYKINYRNPVMMKCVDKYHVREYVESKGLGNILNELFFVVDSPEKIDFASLPEKFALKVTNGSETNIFCRDKSTLDEAATKQKLTDFLSMGNASAGREWAYEGSSKLIIAERFMEDDSNPDGSISDYKFLCFNGEPHYIVYDCDRFAGHKRNIYDLDWNNLNIGTDCPQIDREIPKPENLDDMIEIARKLSEDFPAVRVDLYDIKGTIVFGELTFYPWSGYVQYTPDSFDFEVGKLFPLVKCR
jgi:hypothetical protein